MHLEGAASYWLDTVQSSEHVRGVVGGLVGGLAHLSLIWFWLLRAPAIAVADL